MEWISSNLLLIAYSIPLLPWQLNPCFLPSSSLTPLSILAFISEWLLPSLFHWNSCSWGHRRPVCCQIQWSVPSSHLTSLTLKCLPNPNLGLLPTSLVFSSLFLWVPLHLPNSSHWSAPGLAPLYLSSLPWWSHGLSCLWRPSRDFPVVQGLRPGAPNAGVWVQSLVGELRHDSWHEQQRTSKGWRFSLDLSAKSQQLIDIG